MTATGSSLIRLHKQSCARQRSIYVCGELLISPESAIRHTHTPGFVGRLEMTVQPLFQFGTVTLNAAPDRRVIDLQTALGEQLFDIAERQRVPKIPVHGTKNQLRRRLPPLEDCRSGCVLHDLFRLPGTPPKLQHIRFFQLNRLMSENRVNDYPSCNRALGTKPVRFGRVET